MMKHEMVSENKSHYEVHYNKHKKRKRTYVFDEQKFLRNTILIDTKCKVFYIGDFYKKLKGQKILELYCGYGQNTTVMADFGGEVYANDIAEECGLLIDEVDATNNLETPITFVSGDFLEIDFDDSSFDIIIGKAFNEWKKHDLHLERINSSKRYRKIGENHLETVKIIHVSPIERLAVLPQLIHQNKRKLRGTAFRVGKYLTKVLRCHLSRIKAIELYNPKSNAFI
ncbi:MAG: methyltransferase domain-containing protein [Flavobacteriaceae bacterium]|nr:methyltransferase domain-containing protein [Flavobacteriaceae bacterium]